MKMLATPTSSANPVSQGASFGPLPPRLLDMLNVTNESAKLVTAQLNNLTMELNGACRRIDKLEARMADFASQTINLIGQSAPEARAIMQTAANNNDEFRYKLTH